MQDKILNIDEVSRYLKIPKSTIYKLSQKGKIPSIKIGKQLRFRKSSLDNWLIEQESASGARLDKAASNSGIDSFPQNKSKQVLLVDDDTLVLKAINKLLKTQNYNVESSQSGEDALLKIKNSKFDLIIIDVRMPGMDGIETLKKIREFYFTNNLPQIKEIIITGYMNPEAQQEAVKLGVTDYIHKPFAINEFLKTIQNNFGLESACS